MKNLLADKIAVITGAGGGGYLVIINDTPIKDALQIRIRRS